MVIKKERFKNERLFKIKRKDEKTFDSTCEHLVISGCGMTFELKIYIYGIDF